MAEILVLGFGRGDQGEAVDVFERLRERARQVRDLAEWLPTIRLISRFHSFVTDRPEFLPDVIRPSEDLESIRKLRDWFRRGLQTNVEGTLAVISPDAIPDP